MDADFLAGQPFRAAGETKAADRASECAEPVPQKGPLAALGCQAVVIVRFRIINIASDSFVLTNGIIQIPGDLLAGIILEQFRIGPLHTAIGQQAFGRLPGSAQTLQQKDGFRKLLLDAGHDVFPSCYRNLVTGIAAKTVHAPTAPSQQRICDQVPEFDIMLFEFHKVFPNRSPRSRAGEFAGRGFEEEFRVVFLEGRTPAGVVDHNVDEHSRTQGMRRACQFAELVNARGALVELDQGGIHRG